MSIVITEDEDPFSAVTDFIDWLYLPDFKSPARLIPWL